MAKVKLDLANKTPEQKVTFGTTVETKMTGNPDFVTPVPALTALNGARVALNTAILGAAAARDASIQATSVLGQKETAFDLVITQLGNYVETTSGGDAAKIQGAGMEVQAGRQPPAPMPQVQNLSATGGDAAGECDLNWQPVKNARNYIVEMSPDPVTPTSWAQAGLPTKSRFTVSGLVSGAKYWFRVAASGSQGPGPWSDPATARAS